MRNSERNYSLDKAKIKFLLLEGIHHRAREIIESAGYTNIVEKSGALTPEALHKALKGVHFVGIRSRTQLDAAAIEAANRLTAIGCFCIGTNQVDTAARRRWPAYPFSMRRLPTPAAWLNWHWQKSSC